MQPVRITSAGRGIMLDLSKSMAIRILVPRFSVGRHALSRMVLTLNGLMGVHGGGIGMAHYRSLLQRALPSERSLLWAVGFLIAATVQDDRNKNPTIPLRLLSRDRAVQHPFRESRRLCDKLRFLLFRHSYGYPPSYSFQQKRLRGHQ
jgi:hypothetical protein